jgi:hypothetical protein
VNRFPVFFRHARLILVLAGGCSALLPRLDLQTPPPRLAVAPPAPDADRLMACFGTRLARYVESTPGGPPPVIVEVAGFFNRNPSTLQRLELPTDATLLLESLLSSAGPAVAFREANRRDAAPADGSGGGPPSTLKVKADIQIVEANVASTNRFFDFGLFGGNADASGRDDRQASLAAITLVTTAVDPQGLGTHGLGASLRVVFERVTQDEHNFAASFSSLALGYNEQTKIVHGYGHALRLGAALQLVTVLSRATRVGADEYSGPRFSDNGLTGV